jgi:formylglycine-generating enzyme required for sulfatase activity
VSISALRSPAALDDPVGMRRAGRELLSLALMDARNQLLLRLAQDESATGLRRAVEAGWYQEHWIACHPQRNRGEACDDGGVRLAGLEPAVGHWRSGAGAPPTPEQVRDYLAATLEVTLDLLASTAEEDQALHFFRQSLLHEDRLSEAWDEARGLGQPASRVQREPLWMPAQRWLLGSAPGGYVPLLERWAHAVDVPAFEIDAQPVNWAQYVEFAEDGGYDRAEWWSADGWAWARAEGRRAPAHVEQLRGAVLLERGGAMQRAAAGQPAMHLTRHEAEAWCRWAGRRLPTEPEWELAACSATSRGFVWGDVFEWVAGKSRPWPGGGEAVPGALDHWPGTPAAVLRGASFATRARCRHPMARRFAAAASDFMFCGFRSCAF